MHKMSALSAVLHAQRDIVRRMYSQGRQVWRTLKYDVCTVMRASTAASCRVWLVRAAARVHLRGHWRSIRDLLSNRSDQRSLAKQKPLRCLHNVVSHNMPL